MCVCIAVVLPPQIETSTRNQQQKKKVQVQASSAAPSEATVAPSKAAGEVCVSTSSNSWRSSEMRALTVAWRCASRLASLLTPEKETIRRRRDCRRDMGCDAASDAYFAVSRESRRNKAHASRTVNCSSISCNSRSSAASCCRKARARSSALPSAFCAPITLASVTDKGDCKNGDERRIESRVRAFSRHHTPLNALKHGHAREAVSGWVTDLVCCCPASVESRAALFSLARGSVPSTFRSWRLHRAV
jgi:hypothetical protein